jgi:hypothetical protein
MALLGWLAFRAGVLHAIATAIWEPSVGLNPDAVRSLFAPARLAGDGIALAAIGAWAALGWIFWIVATHRALRRAP